MANWYGIEGIEFHYNGPWASPEVSLDGIRDTEGVTAEETMWERFEESTNLDSWDEPGEIDRMFEGYMLENADEVKDLIRLARKGKAWSYRDRWGEEVWAENYVHGDTPEDAMNRWDEFMENEEYKPEVDEVVLIWPED